MSIDELNRAEECWLETLARELEGDGIRRLSGWGDWRRSPAMRFGDYANQPWLDHLYRLRFPDGQIVYRAEPYWLTEDDLAELEQVRGDGWKIYFGGYPWHAGSTVVISFERVAR